MNQPNMVTFILKSSTIGNVVSFTLLHIQPNGICYGIDGDGSPCFLEFSKLSAHYQEKGAWIASKAESNKLVAKRFRGQCKDILDKISERKRR